MRQRPDRFDGDAHAGAIADYCPLCGFAAPPGELSGNTPACPSCGESIHAPRLRDPRRGPEPGANTWS